MINEDSCGFDDRSRQQENEGSATRSNFPDFLARNNETNYFHADEITLIGQLVKKVEVKISKADEIRAATLFSFGYLIKIV